MGREGVRESVCERWGEREEKGEREERGGKRETVGGKEWQAFYLQ
jgi:hypothetical protein